MAFIPALLMNRTSTMIGVAVAFFLIFVGLRNRSR